MQVTQCYTAFSPGSRVISLLIFPSRGFRNRKPEESRPRGRFGADSPGASFHGDELVAGAQGFHPLAGDFRHGQATLFVTGTEVIVSMPWTSRIPSRRVTFVMALRL